MAKIIVGMSGGVDSAAAALLLKQEGHEVIGVTLRTWNSDDGYESRCCEIEDARVVAWKLGIPYHVFNCINDFREKVTKPFVDSYLNGMTPNPCIECNRYVKWDKMMYITDILRADYIATGHYASVVRMDNGRYTVKKALHSEKDQTYMLYKLTQEQLARTLMPVGKYSKDEVRKIAVDAGLPVAKKPDSQEICFVTQGDYTDFITKNSESGIPGEGWFVDSEGNRLGKHKGIIHYTIGQRKGLGLSMGTPVYVNKILPENNEVVVGGIEELYVTGIICSEVNYLSISGLETGEQLRCKVKIRYHHPGRDAVVEAVNDHEVKIYFDQPVKSVAPGQSAVFYDDNDCVIGGGIIQKIL